MEAKNPEIRFGVKISRSTLNSTSHAKVSDDVAVLWLYPTMDITVARQRLIFTGLPCRLFQLPGYGTTILQRKLVQGQLISDSTPAKLNEKP